jgi:hypothetical protein
MAHAVHRFLLSGLLSGAGHPQRLEGWREHHQQQKSGSPAKSAPHLGKG